jgi:hypothetical protein
MNRTLRPQSRLLALLLCGLTACATWKTQSAPPGEVLATPTNKLTRVTLADGSRHTLNLAHVEGDSLVGVHPRSISSRKNHMAFALTDVRKVELAEVDGKRTQLTILGIVGGWVLLCALTDCLQELEG